MVVVILVMLLAVNTAAEWGNEYVYVIRPNCTLSCL